MTVMLVFRTPLPVIMIVLICTSIFAATEKRVGSTSNVITNMKSLKMSGLAGKLSSLIQQLRAEELQASISFRLIGCS